MNVFERYFRNNGVICPPCFPDGLALIIVIPVLNDRDIFETVDSICKCSTSGCSAGVIIVVNHAQDCDDAVKISNRELADEIGRKIVFWEKIVKGRILFHLVKAFDLPVKTAGVGLARKIGMDIAADYFFRENKTSGVIVSLDADTFVEAGYCDEVVRFFREYPVAGVSIAYEHRLDLPECTGQIREAMVRYEIYLRYYQMALKYCGHPHAFHTIGSAFAVRAFDYVAQGGMNKRQAGEDFYFIQKLISTGRYADLVTTCVYPSSRISSRTPFGTGQSILQIIGNEGKYFVYDFEAFRVLKPFFEMIGQLYKAQDLKILEFLDMQPWGLNEFLIHIGFPGMIKEINANSASEKQFTKRFFDNFNAFRVLKYLNYVHDGIYRKREILEVTNILFSASGLPECAGAEDMLFFLRSYSRNANTC